MRILPVSGHDIGFTRKGWSAIGAVTAQSAPSQDDAYWSSLEALQVTSVKEGDVRIENTTETVRSPSSPWGGREVDTGSSYSTNAELVLEGDVAISDMASDEEIKARIEADFSEWAHESNASVVAAVEDARSGLHGDDNISVSARVTSLSRNPDGSVKVSMSVSIEADSRESLAERRDRLREQDDELRFTREEMS